MVLYSQKTEFFMGKCNDPELNALLRRAKEKDENAVSDLLTRYHLLFEKEIVRKGIPPARKDDARSEIHDVFCKALGTYDESVGTTFGLYLQICVRHRLTDFAKKLAAEEKLLSLDGRDMCVPSQAERSLLLSESNARMLAVLKKYLTPFEYSVAEFMIAGCKNREIAGKLGKKPKQVENAKARIKAKLAAHRDEFCG